jgi:hypothetical protein
MAETKHTQRDEIVGALMLVLLFATVMIGREAGNFYASYEEMKSLKVLFKIEEEELSGYLRGILVGETQELSVGITVTLPSVSDEAELVTRIPDYARRWLISVALSPVVVRQPSVSDVELQLFVEGELVADEMMSFPKAKVPYLSFIDREIELHVDDPSRMGELIEMGARAHGGEVEVSASGMVRAHLWFLEAWLPFTTTRYPLVEPQSPVYLSSEWRTMEGQPAGSVEAGEAAYVYVRLGNPARVHSFRDNLTLLVLRNGVQVAAVIKETPLAALSEGSYIFLFTPAEPGVYSYALISRDKVLVDSTAAPWLTVG